jgi:hypothetical protein
MGYDSQGGPSTFKPDGQDMAQIIVTYWRDIPSQVVAKAGRRNEKRMLSDRFQEAIDMAAMRGGAAETDAYLEEWRRGAPIECSDDLADEVEKLCAQLESEYGKDQLVALVNNHGRAAAT